MNESDNNNLTWKSALVAKKYLSGVRAAIPFSGEHIKIILKLIEANENSDISFIDFGCGDGILANAILDSFPNSKGILLDLSDVMISAAKKRLDKYKKQLSFVNYDFTYKDWIKSIKFPINTIVSGLAIHHQSNDRKKEIYKEIYDILEPNGIFINLEHVASTCEWEKKLFDNNFIDSIYEFFKSQNDTRSKEELAKQYYYRDDKVLNILAPVCEQCKWLEDVGFKDVDCYFKFYELAIFGGRKIIK